MLNRAVHSAEVAERFCGESVQPDGPTVASCSDGTLACHWLNKSVPHADGYGWWR
jgi:hypothetical protein